MLPLDLDSKIVNAGIGQLMTLDERWCGNMFTFVTMLT